MTLRTYTNGITTTHRLPVEHSVEDAKNVCDFLSSGQPVPPSILGALERIQKQARALMPELLEEAEWYGNLSEAEKDAEWERCPCGCGIPMSAESYYRAHGGK